MVKMAELLVEIFSEEIPARMQKKASEDFAGLIEKDLKEAGLKYGNVISYVTPRRLVCVVDEMDIVIPDIKEERRGPRVDAPETAIKGFLRGAGVSLDECERRETSKGEFWFAIIEKKGGDVKDLLPKIILNAIENLSWPKSMRWGSGKVRWVRPMHSIIALFDGAVLNGRFETGSKEIEFSNKTTGHRFLAPDSFEVVSFTDYKEKLTKAHVILDREERKEIILDGAKEKAKKIGLCLKEDIGLLEEVAGLVENPVVLCGSFDDEFLKVPDEVLIASMKEHQKYFSLLDSDGNLANKFIVVSNMPDIEGNIVDGNERVLRARLSDAKFFWEQDLKIKLEDRIPKLAAITFNDKLGSVADKVERMKKLSSYIAEFNGADFDKVERAAQLCKADLVSEMVFEFPEVQGLMGSYYAMEQGEGIEVAEAIAEHYSPAGPNDKCPSAKVSVALAMADKVDTLVGFFAIGQKPTGSKDPYALRRAALGVIRLILENDVRINLDDLFKKSMELYLEQDCEEIEKRLENTIKVTKPFTDIKAYYDAYLREDLQIFIDDRLKVSLKDKGYRYDLIEAVFSGLSGDDIYQKISRIKAVDDFLDTENGKKLIAAYKRAVNIVRAEEKKDKVSYNGVVDDNMFKQEEENKLFEALSKVEKAIFPALESENYVAAMNAMATLREPVDKFFDKVTVNDDDNNVRKNRLNLLSRVRYILDQVADFSKLEG